MKYAGIKTVTVTLALLLVVPLPPGKTETTARASARIMLSLPTRVTLAPNASGSDDLLCLNHVPAWTYHVYVRDVDQPPSADLRSVGKPGQHCVSLPSSSVGKLVFVVAE
ncbi:hypothetical protein [Microbulbifer aggregans]|uniref:hypothetical protein n=1 Tax=Microbulbifer aggregans TaxID=1769779 RepID=UPI001CFD6435|nr:hypothetical protein [Microbulbifer aggregans]